MSEGDTTQHIIRPASRDDAGALLRIYAPYVTDSAVSFEADVPDEAEFARRIEKCSQHWCWLLAEVDGQVAGYAYGGAHRPRHAYRLSVETSAYMDPTFQRRGIASQLYTQLMATLAGQGYHMAFAGIALPNAASVAFHHRHGFRDIGIFPQVGYKFGRWHDTHWLYRPLKQGDAHVP